LYFKNIFKFLVPANVHYLQF